jgi:lipopolysaccharide export system permease protein
MKGAWRLSIADRAYAREMLVPLGLGLMVLVLVMAGNFVYWGINSVVNQGIGLMPVVRLFFLAMPGFAIQGIAVGLLLAVCLVVSRAVRDNEIVALRVGGASLGRILAPFWAVSIAASLANYALLEHIAPKTNNLAEKSLAKLMNTQATKLIENDKYFRVGNYYFYVQSVEDRVLRNVMVYERGAGNFSAFAPTTFPTVSIAREAREDPAKPNSWIFTDVVQHFYNDKGEQTLETQVDEWKIDVGQELSNYWAQQKNPFSMTGSELSKQIEVLDNSAVDAGKVREMRVEYFRRFALPTACLVLALAAAPLSLRFARHGSFAGLVCAFGLAFLWQGFDSWFRALGIAGRLEPPVAAWSTNALFLLVGLVLLWRER